MSIDSRGEDSGLEERGGPEKRGPETPARDGGDITRLLGQVKEGDRRAYDRLFTLAYDELKRIAQAHHRRVGGGETMRATALANEAWIRLAGETSPQWNDRVHFFAVVSTAIRHVLIDQARRQRAIKRGGDVAHVPLDEANPVSAEAAGDLLALDEALDALHALDERQARVVEMRVFADLSVDDTARALGVSSATVKRDWAFARRWLRREMSSARTRDAHLGA